MSGSLFPDEPLRMAEDAEGGILYWPALVPADEAARWFAELERKVSWKSERRPMYDRIVDVPRLLAAYRLDALPETLPLLKDISRAVAAHVDAPFNAVGLNLYRPTATTAWRCTTTNCTR